MPDASVEKPCPECMAEITAEAQRIVASDFGSSDDMLLMIVVALHRVRCGLIRCERHREGE